MLFETSALVEWRSGVSKNNITRYPASLSLRGAQLTQVNISVMLLEERAAYPEAPPPWQLTGNTIAGINAPRRKARLGRKKITMQTNVKRHLKLQDWRRSIVMCAMISCLRSRGNLRPSIYCNKFSWSLGQEKKMISRDRDHSEGWGWGVWLLEPSSKRVLLWFFSIQLWKKHTLNPEITFLYQLLENHIVILIAIMLKKPCLKVQNLQYKFWDNSPPLLKIVQKFIRFGGALHPFNIHVNRFNIHVNNFSVQWQRQSQWSRKWYQTW